MKRGSRDYSRVSAAAHLIVPRFIRALLAGLACVAHSAAAAELPAMVHFTQAEILHETPGAPAPISRTVDESTLEGQWETTVLPLTLKRKGTPEAGGNFDWQTVWLRVRLDAFADQRGPIEFYLLRWLAPGQLAIYGDGRLIYRSFGSPMWNLASRPSVLLPLGRADDGVPPRTLLIRLDRPANQNAALSSFYVGEAERVVAMAERRDLILRHIPYMISAVFVLLGIFGLGMWRYRHSFPGHLIFAIAVLGLVWRWHFQMGIQRVSVSDTWLVWLTLDALLWQWIAIHFLVRSLHGRRQPWLDRTLVATVAAISILTLPTEPLPLPDLLRLRSDLQVPAFAIGLVTLAVGAWNAWRSRAIDAGLIVGSLVIAVLTWVIDYHSVLRSTNAEGFFLTTYGPRVFTLVCMFLMFRHYVRVIGEIARVNASLERRVREREAELAQSYARLSEIERNQTLIEERQRLMQDMHDGLGSSLTSALRVAESRPDRNAELEAVIRDCIDDLKLTIDSLEPVESDLVLLLATLRFRFGPRLKSAGVNLHWEVTNLPKLDWLNPGNSLHVLRILQEALANVLKHTRANLIRVETGADEHVVWVTVADNGAGFDVAKAGLRGGRGLLNQHRRAAELGGRVELESSASGTRFSLVLPRQAVGDAAQTIAAS